MQLHRGEFRGEETAAGFSDGELSRLFAETPRPAAGPLGASEEREYEEVGLSVEAGLAVPGHFVAIRGWLADPHDRTHSVWLEMNGALRRLNHTADSYRPDLIHLRKLGNVRPGLRAGFFSIEPWDAGIAGGGEAYLHAVLRTKSGPVLLSAAVRLGELGTRRLVHVLDDFEGGSWPPAALSRIARPVLGGVAAARRRADWLDRQLDVAGQPGAGFSYLVGVSSNAEILGHLLGFLEMDPRSQDAEVVLVLQSPHLKPIVDELVRPWRGGEAIRAIKVLTPGNEVTFGSAMQAGMGVSEGRVLAITTDEMIPPEAGWIGHCLAALEPGGMLVPAVQTFDGRPVDLGHAFDLAWQTLEHDHSAIAAALATALGSVARLPYGAIVADRQRALAPGFLDDAFSSVELCFADLFRREAAAIRVEPRMLFIHNRVPETRSEDTVERLWDLYAFAAAGESAASGDPRRAASPAPVAKPGKTRRGR